jgi:type VI secretion system protein ImpM
MRDDQDLIGLFGKTRSQRDFVRVNIGAPAAQDLDAWLRASVMTLPSLRAHLPVDPLVFVYRAPSGACLIGVLRGSADGVGREFPLAVFAPFDVRAHAHQWSALPLAYTGFVHAAAALLDEVDGIDPAQLPARLARLPVPDADAIARSAAQGRAALAQISADELLDRLFARPTGNPEGERWVDDHLHGLGMLVQACDRVAGGPPQAGAITLDCPVSSELELLFWLELTRRRLAWTGPPSLLWAPPQYRMLLALGSPGPSLLGVLGTPGTFDSAIWPLVADDEQTAARGGQLLSVDQRAAIERVGQSGAELLDILAADGRP